MSTAPSPEVALGNGVNDARPLHLVLKSDYPQALCGYLVTDDFNPTRTDTAGRDRCPECLKIAAARGLKR